MAKPTHAELLSFLDAADKGTVPNSRTANSFLQLFGLEVDKNAKPAEVIARLKAAVERAAPADSFLSPRNSVAAAPVAAAPVEIKPYGAGRPLAIQTAQLKANQMAQARIAAGGAAPAAPATPTLASAATSAAPRAMPTGQQAMSALGVTPQAGVSGPQAVAGLYGPTLPNPAAAAAALNGQPIPGASANPAATTMSQGAIREGLGGAKETRMEKLKDLLKSPARDHLPSRATMGKIAGHGGNLLKWGGVGMGLNTAATADSGTGVIGGGLQSVGSLMMGMPTLPTKALGLGATVLGTMMASKKADPGAAPITLAEINAQRNENGLEPLARMPGKPETWVEKKARLDGEKAAAAAAKQPQGPAEHPMMAIYREALAKMNQGPAIDPRGGWTPETGDPWSVQHEKNMNILRSHQKDQALFADKIITHANNTAQTDATLSSAQARLAHDYQKDAFTRGTAGIPKNYTNDGDGKQIPDLQADQISTARAQRAHPGVFSGYDPSGRPISQQQQQEMLANIQTRELATRAFDSKHGSSPSQAYVELRNEGQSNIVDALSRGGEGFGGYIRAHTPFGPRNSVVSDGNRRMLTEDVAPGQPNLQNALRRGAFNTGY